MSGWELVYEGLEATREGLREALCVLGNGYFATRGAGDEARADGTCYPGTYLAGGYNRAQSRIAGRTVENEDLVNFPNWLCLRVRAADGPWFDPYRSHLLDYRLALDVEHGILHRQLRFRDPAGRETAIESWRLVSMADPHCGAIRMRVTAENWSGPLEVHSAIDPRVTNTGVARYRALTGTHLEVEGRGHRDPDIAWVTVRTTQSRLTVALAARTRIYADSGDPEPAMKAWSDDGVVGHQARLELGCGNAVEVEKVVALHSSRDAAIADPRRAACQRARRAPRFEELQRSHCAAWKRLWQRADIRLDAGPGEQQLAVRLHVFHLLQTVSPHSRSVDAGVPARGLHGEAYRGHVFWDEVFIFSFYNFRFPELSRALLEYRHRRLEAARAAARAAGLRGALFPWQSASDGREESQRYHLNPNSGHWIPDHSHLQRHVNAAIAYNIWHYYETTGDLDFISGPGGEMLLEIARLFSSMVTHNPDEDRYELLGVMGPDEYHDRYPDAERPGVDNNTYTNVMVAWTLQFAVRVLETLPPDRSAELSERVALDPAEASRWQRIGRRIRVVFHADGIPSQFEGYESLQEFDWDGYRRRYGDIQRLDRILEAEGDTPNRYKLSKQADVLMLLYLFSAERLCTLFESLGYPFDPRRLPDIVDYYTQRTSHGSTLSRVVHSWVLARADRPRGWSLLVEALRSDIDDVQGGTTAEGVHLGAMAATVDVLQRCYTGCEILDGILRMDPCLPDELHRLEQTISYRGNTLSMVLEDGRTRVAVGRGAATDLRYRYRSRTYVLEPGAHRMHRG